MNNSTAVNTALAEEFVKACTIEQDEKFLPQKDYALPNPDNAPRLEGVMKKMIRAGEGARPPVGAFVTVHYRGEVPLNGSGYEFDNSWDRQEPYTFEIGRGFVIKGWDKGVLSMRPQERAFFLFEPEFGYPNGMSDPYIPMQSKLLFEIELLSWTLTIDQKAEEMTPIPDKVSCSELPQGHLNVEWSIHGDEVFTTLTIDQEDTVESVCHKLAREGGQRDSIFGKNEFRSPHPLSTPLKSLGVGEGCRLCLVSFWGGHRMADDNDSYYISFYSKPDLDHIVENVDRSAVVLLGAWSDTPAHAEIALDAAGIRFI